jgi:hypothetical protein
MESLITGIKIFFGGRRSPAGRLQLSAGTIPAHGRCRYEEGALAPAATWRPPSWREHSMLLGRGIPPHYGSAIGVIPMPERLLRLFGVLRKAAARGLSKPELQELLGSRDFHEPVAAVSDYMREHFSTELSGEEQEEIKGGIRVNAPAQSTTTEHPETRELVGLHVDDWSRIDVSRRAFAPNRLTLNLGCQDRFFIFLNQPIAAIYERVHGLVRSTDGCTSIARMFMTSYPDYPVVRLRVRPGEAYIAPTENLIHDGCTLDMSAADISLSLRGRIAVLPGSVPGFIDGMENEDGKRLLRKLEASGLYVFHGSPARMDVCEPRQAHTRIRGERVQDDRPGVHASPRLDVAIFMAIVNQANYGDGYSRFQSDQSGRVRLMTTRQTLARLETAVGYVYVFDKSLFRERNVIEYISYDPVRPLTCVALGKRALPRKIELVSSKISSGPDSSARHAEA